MTRIVLQKSFLTGLAIFAILYGLTVLWFVPTQPTVPVGCLLTGSGQNGGPGVEIRDTSRLTESKGYTPAIGDRIVQLYGKRIQSFLDWVRVHQQLRRVRIDSAAMVQFGFDPTDDQSRSSDLSLIEYPDKSRYVKMWFVRAGEETPVYAWVPLVPQPTFGVSLSLMWFVLQLFVIVVGGVAYWNRPFDQPVRTFFALSSVSMFAFVGGGHWWVISASPWLVLLFAISAILLPAVLLHFFLVYPYPVPIYSRSRRVARFCLYAVPTAVAALVSAMIGLGWFFTQNFGPGPFAWTLERLSGNVVHEMMPVLRTTVYVFFGVALVYFLACLLALTRSLRSARNPLEENQIRPIWWAAVFATLPIFYTVHLALFDQVNFALGAARLPMFLASLAFMLAYGIGIAKYKLMLVDQVISRGVWYYSSSVGLALLFSALIAVGAVNALHQDLAIFGHTIPLILVLTIAIFVLGWGRDAAQRILDRRFFSEKYQLDKALQRMNRVVSSVLEPEAVSESLLNSCREVLRVNQAALYLRKSNTLEFRMATAVGPADFPLQIVLTPDAFDALNQSMVLQRAPQSQSPAQALIRQLRAEVVHGLEIQGKVAGILVLGAKPSNAAYTAEDLAFVNAMARITGVALHCATVQQDVSRLNQDLQLKIDRIADQERQLAVLQRELTTLSKTSGSPSPASEGFDRAGIQGNSPAMHHVLETVRKVAGSDASVLIRGESGTGKELLAKAIHVNSARKNGPLVSVHCGALSPTLLESELFGHVKGAFTDAKEGKVGRFSMADGGTLFLDEIGDISLDVQVKLLRVLQERTFEPVGGTQSIQVDVRIVAATHRNLEQLIAEGKFREDLFYRLNVISITLPPLRERREDLFELAVHFLRRAAEKADKRVFKIDDDALRAIESYHWPGNIRELQNAIERAVVLAEGEMLRLDDLPVEVREHRPDGDGFRSPDATPAAANLDLIRPTRVPAVSSGASRQISLQRKTVPSDQSEQITLRTALEECDGNKSEAARLLGMPRSTFFSKLRKYGIK
jgi:transcriptional regulator with GAF, ATPase, and Fis domain